MMKYLTPLFTLLLGMLLISNNADARVIMRFQPEIKENARLLSDVVIIINSKQGMCDLDDLSLSSRPLFGEVIHKNNVINWLHSQTNCENVKVTWLGKIHATVEGEKKSSITQLNQLAYNSLAARLKSRYNNFTIKQLSQLSPSGIAIDEFSPHCEDKITSRMRVWLDSPQQSIPVWFKVSIKAPILTSNIDLPAKTNLSLTDFTLKQTNIAKFNHPLDKLKPGYRLKYPLKKNQILTLSDLEPIPDVTAGSQVTVFSENEKLIKKSSAIALGDGYINSIIWIKDFIDNKRYPARVIKKNEVEIEK